MYMLILPVRLPLKLYGQEFPQKINVLIKTLIFWGKKPNLYLFVSAEERAQIAREIK